MLHMGFSLFLTCPPDLCYSSLWLVLSIPRMISGSLIQKGDASCINKCYYHSFFMILLFFLELLVIAVAWFILSVLPARLGKIIMCNFCCGQLQILVGLLRYDCLLKIFCATVWFPWVFYNGFVTYLLIRWQGRGPPSELLDKC